MLPPVAESRPSSRPARVCMLKDCCGPVLLWILAMRILPVFAKAAEAAEMAKAKGKAARAGSRAPYAGFSSQPLRRAITVAPGFRWLARGLGCAARHAPQAPAPGGSRGVRGHSL